MTRRLRSGLLACLALLGLVLSGCAPTLPTDGPVQAVEAEEVVAFNYVYRPSEPSPGASPEEIINGFIQAGAGPQDDYSVARQYLTAEARSEWSPGQQTMIYSTPPNYQPAGEGEYQMELNVDSRVDSTGIMFRTDEFVRETFELEQVEGEWRISSLPEGLGKILDQTMFERAHTAVEQYFFDPQLRYAVPDQRWFVTRPSLLGDIATSILAGPAPWLDQAVVSAFPRGAELGRPTVTEEEQVAYVDLNPAALAGASQSDLLLMQRQMEMALEQVGGVEEVRLTVNQEELELPNPEELPEDQQLNLQAHPQVSNIQVGVLNDQLALQRGTVTEQIAQLPDIAELEPQSPAMSELTGADAFAFLNGDGDALYHVRPGQDEAELVLEGEDLTRPSMDNFGWTWTVSHDDGETMVNTVPFDDPAAGEARQISADLLEDRRVTSLRIAQDGTRAVLVVDDATESTIYIAAVIRDEQGVPRALGQAVPLPSESAVTEVRWSGSTGDELLAWSPYSPGEAQEQGVEELTRDIYRIQLSTGEVQSLYPVLGLLNVSAGEGQTHVSTESESTAYSSLVGSQWQPNYDIEIRDLAYPG